MGATVSTAPVWKKYFFFFSSRRRHTRFDCDWSSDVCSSDLLADHREITDQTSITRMCIGLAWEEWYIRTQLPEVIDHPGEVEVDKIFMTPDGEELTTLIVDRRTRY